MIILGKERERLISKLNFNEQLKKLTKGEFIHNELEFCCMKLSYSLEKENFSPHGIDVIPLWESELSITGFFINDKNNHVFIHYFIEDLDNFETIGSTTDSLINYLIENEIEYEYEDEIRSLLS